MGVSRGVEFQAREEMCLDRRPGTAATTQPILGFQEASQEEEKDALLLSGLNHVTRLHLFPREHHPLKEEEEPIQESGAQSRLTERGGAEGGTTGPVWSSKQQCLI
jgi:hypothetical protein